MAAAAFVFHQLDQLRREIKAKMPICFLPNDEDESELLRVN